jgi:hypothetical protein
MPDIYSAPRAKLDAPVQDPGEPPKKPKAVLLLQMWALVIVALVAVGFMKNLHNLDGRAYYVFMGMSGKGRSYVMIGIIVSLLAMLYALDKRALFGRVIGIVVIFLSSAPVFLQFFMVRMVPRPQQPGYYAVLIFLCLLFIYWGYAFSFSERARGYFGQPPDE